MLGRFAACAITMNYCRSFSTESAQSGGPGMSALTPLLGVERRVSLLSSVTRDMDHENACFTRSIAGCNGKLCMLRPEQHILWHVVQKVRSVIEVRRIAAPRRSLKAYGSATSKGRGVTTRCTNPVPMPSVLPIFTMPV